MVFKYRTINKAVLGELFIAFVLALFTFNFILVTERVLRMTKMFSSVGASMTDMLRILLWLQPQITVLTTPIAFLIAVLLTYGRMEADSELVVLRSSGMSLGALARPVFAFGVACFVLSVSASVFAAPLGARMLRMNVASIVAKRAPMAIEEGIFNTSFPDVVIYVNERSRDGNLREIFIHDSRKGKEPLVLTARDGRLEPSGESGITFDLNDGSIHLVRGTGITEIAFESYSLSFPLVFDTPRASLEELAPAGLLRAVRRAEDTAFRTRAFLELHRRLSLPSLNLILMVLGLPLSLMAGKSGRMGGLVLGIAVFSAYYALLIYTEGLARSGTLPVTAGAWAPNAALLAFAVFMYRKAAAR